MPWDPAQSERELRFVEGQAPSDSLPAVFDLTMYCKTLGVTVDTANVTVSIEPNDLGDMQYTGLSITPSGVISARFTGGRPETEYAISYTIPFTSGDRLSRIVWMRCQYNSYDAPLGGRALRGPSLPIVVLPLVLIEGCLVMANPWDTNAPTDPTNLAPRSIWNNNGKWAWVGPPGA